MSSSPSKSASFVREAIRTMSAYTLEPLLAADKLDQNESPWDLPPGLKEEVLARISKRSWNRYPEFGLDRIRGAVASYAGIARDEVLVGNGSNELLLATLATFVAPGAPVVRVDPTFALYEKITRIMGGISIPVAGDPASGVLPVEEMVAAIETCERPPVVIVCSPNNPTGASLREGQLETLLATGAMVILDRAYGEFGENPDAVRPRERLVILSTFSKAWGLAGLRIGWLAATPENCREISKVKLPYNLNLFSEEAALVALENPDLVRERTAALRAERVRLSAELGAMEGVRPFPSEANFIAFETTMNPNELYRELASRGTLVRDISGYPGMSRALRVSVGAPEENDRFLGALREAMAAHLIVSNGGRSERMEDLALPGEREATSLASSERDAPTGEERLRRNSRGESND
ncbi:MAG: histidinol-phosphate transaminase [Thermoanaerobaculia bacterium]